MQSRFDMLNLTKEFDVLVPRIYLDLPINGIIFMQMRQCVVWVAGKQILIKSY